jgi:hypothetical protein
MIKARHSCSVFLLASDPAAVGLSPLTSRLPWRSQPYCGSRSGWAPKREAVTTGLTGCEIFASTQEAAFSF